jgi:cyclic pyranopterin phosphate synthase
VKINMVVRRGVNDHCVLAMAERFRGRPEILRFIEYMDVGSTNGWRLEQVVSAGELRDTISARWPLEPIVPDRLGEVATRYRYRDGAGEVGFIHSVSAPFCASCTRARLSAEGRLHTCLFATRGHDLRALVRGGASDAELSREIALVWAARSDRYSAERAEQGSRRVGAEKKIEMSYIGG